MDADIRQEIENALKFILAQLKTDRLIEFSVEYNFMNDQLMVAIRHGEGQGTLTLVDKDFKKRRRQAQDNPPKRRR